MDAVLGLALCVCVGGGCLCACVCVWLCAHAYVCVCTRAFLYHQIPRSPDRCWPGVWGWCWSCCTWPTVATPCTVSGALSRPHVCGWCWPSSCGCVGVDTSSGWLWTDWVKCTWTWTRLAASGRSLDGEKQKHRQHFEGSRPEWCISSMIYSRDTPFWSGTLEFCSVLNCLKMKSEDREIVWYYL